MLIGNKERFAIELTPVAAWWELRYGPERAAWAGLALWVTGQNLCRHVRAGEEGTREYFYVPLAPVADWIVDNHATLCFEERASQYKVGPLPHDAIRTWGETPAPAGYDEDSWLDAREAFWSRHFLAASADGARLPNVALLREDDATLVAWQPPRLAAPPGVDMIHPRGVATVPWGDVNGVLLDLVGHVAKAFEAARVERPYPWMKAEPRTWQAVEPENAARLYCGRDLAAIEAIAGPLAPLLKATPAGDPGASPTLQIIRDLPPAPSPSIAAEIRTTVARAELTDDARKRSWLKGRQTAFDAARAGESPQAQGQLAARAVRDELDLDGQPVPSVDDLCTRYGVLLEHAVTTAIHERMLIAGRTDRGVSATILTTPRTTTAWGKRFEEARALGHALLDPLRGGAFGAASSRWALESRRHRSGAFAAELLLPRSALAALSHGALDGAAEGDRFAELLERYGVGARTAAHQLYNHRWLSDAAIRDELIEQYGHREG